MDTKTLRRWVRVIKTHGGDEATRIRLAEVIRKNIAENTTSLRKLGLTQKKLDQFPKR